MKPIDHVPAFFAIAFTGCSLSDIGTAGEMGAPDLTTRVLCSTAECVAAPCTGGCTYDARPMGGCPSGLKPIDAATAQTCTRFCGLLRAPGGCFRFKSEDSCCTSDCHCYGSVACYPRQSNVDTVTGGEICREGYECDTGAPLEDAGPPGVCLDSGAWGPWSLD